jgi:hypothetical protein
MGKPPWLKSQVQNRNEGVIPWHGVGASKKKRNEKKIIPKQEKSIKLV